MKAEETVHTQIHGPWSSQISCGIQALSQWMILWYGMNVQSATVPYMQMQFHFPVISIGNDQESPCGLLQYIDSVLVGYCTILCKLHQRFQFINGFLHVITHSNSPIFGHWKVSRISHWIFATPYIFMLEMINVLTADDWSTICISNKPFSEWD